MAKSVDQLEKELAEQTARGDRLQAQLDQLKRADRGSSPGAGETLSPAQPAPH